MAEDDKGFSFKRLFFRDEETVAQQNQTQEPEPVVKNTQVNYVTNTAPLAPVGVQEQPLLEDFVQRLQNLINQNNQPGFDFLDFTESLFEEKQNPTPEVYKTVFRIAQKIDKTLTPAKLLESAMFYKNLVQQTVDNEVSKGEMKKKVDALKLTHGRLPTETIEKAVTAEYVTFAQRQLRPPLELSE